MTLQFLAENFSGRNSKTSKLNYELGEILDYIDVIYLDSLHSQRLTSYKKALKKILTLLEKILFKKLEHNTNLQHLSCSFYMFVKSR